MLRRHPIENRYCNHCQRTTRHEVKEGSHNCQTCGSVKYPPRVFRREIQGPALSA